MGKFASARHLGSVVRVVFFSILLVGCGGGGGGGDGDPPPHVADPIISSTVVAVFDQSGGEVSRVTATGRPNTFSLSVAPGRSYRFFLLENAGSSNQRVFPLYQGTTNVFDVAASGGGADVTINLGFVDPSGGVAVAANDPLAVAGVTSGGTDATIPAPLAGSTYAQSALYGTWNSAGFVTGDAPTYLGGWYHGGEEFNSSGVPLSMGTVTDVFGYTAIPALAPIELAPSGVFTISGAPYLGMLSHGGDWGVATATLIPGHPDGVKGYNLQFAVKSGTTYATSDFAGSWNVHNLAADGTTTTGMAGWRYGEMSMDVDGNTTWGSGRGSDGNPYTEGSHTLSISSAGIIGSSPDSWGLMTPDKSMFILLAGDGTGGGSDLIIAQRAGGTFASADLEGTWTEHAIATGNGPRWLRGAVAITAGGRGTWLWKERSNGDNSIPGSGTFAISTTGVVTSSTDSSFHGSMSLDKRIIVATATEAGSRYKLMVWQK